MKHLLPRSPSQHPRPAGGRPRAWHGWRLTAACVRPTRRRRLRRRRAGGRESGEGCKFRQQSCTSQAWGWGGPALVARLLSDWARTSGHLSHQAPLHLGPGRQQAQQCVRQRASPAQFTPRTRGTPLRKEPSHALPPARVAGVRRRARSSSWLCSTSQATPPASRRRRAPPGPAGRSPACGAWLVWNLAVIISTTKATAFIVPKVVILGNVVLVLKCSTCRLLRKYTVITHKLGILRINPIFYANLRNKVNYAVRNDA